MKKIISLLLCAALIFAYLPGCDRQEPPMETELPVTQAPTEGIVHIPLELPEDNRPYKGVQLTFLSLLTEGEPRAEVLEQAAEAFSAKTGAEVTFRWFAGDAALLRETVSAGETADIFAASVDDLQRDYRFKVLDLSAMAEETDYASHSYQVLREQIVQRIGYLGAIAQEPLLYGMYYNADAMDDAGVTEFPENWEDFLVFSAYLTGQGYMPLTIDWERANIILELYLQRQMGREDFEAAMQGALWSRTLERIELFRLPIDYAGAGYLAKGDPAAYPGGQEKLALSNVAMVAGSNLLCPEVERSTGMDLNWGVFALPGDGVGKGFAAESNVLAIHRDSPNARAAFDFLMLLTTGEFDQLYADVSGGIPADPGNAVSVRGAKKLLEQAAPHDFGLLREEHNELFSRLWNGYYKTPSYFAGSMNALAWEYVPEPTEGVG